MGNLVLDVPDVAPETFKTNYLDQVVVDFKFPILLEIPETNPVSIQKRLRNKFPNYHLVNNTELVPGAGTRTKVIHEFHGKSGKERVTLSEGNLALSTSAYTNYDDFRDKYKYVFDIVFPYLETDFFTRLGLRYVNRITAPNIRKDLTGWINESLVSHVASGVFGSVDGLKMEVHGTIDEYSKYVFRSGLVASRNSMDTPDNPSNVDFILDFDCFKQDVDANEVFSLLDLYNKTNYNFFWWCLGNKAKSELKGE